ncbi:TetR/AcrR family transcriptional regulator C-terminal ligand-binding domain-containing protein [Streptomyces sp. NPDC003631]|jgi:AcrR family transcriptional regulator|uniref:TetR/AcrR family transcriptional regulator n=1 Tax=Streptomyces lannensis TaxID=766498 RepID=A0ABP7LG48_9ACTN|nr:MULTISPECIES: TetR/AcrR family transcriptional regulator [unclassified Streptomyces]MEE1665003.1 TetR/AcrR family transcriptional regulator C-terminal ligand-binding domain-containing protein [Streptomyces sp. WAC07094]KUJ36007.1 TetR family transcriptional regulator [Streptomyces sp. NRRL F-5122]MBW8699404.1 putative HTH-type transcriptional regulator [Streptomyces sp. MBT84]MDX3260869.1 TetR/AcrR family transcriptional regulator C-terminal ligand-binding domain-containing protein [Streptom
MTSQAADAPDTVAASRRSKITPEREREFFDAVLEQIRSCGYEAVTMEGVAASTRCSKSTLYRQWKTKPQFVAAALRATRCVRISGIDTGSFAGDLRAAAQAAAEWSRRDSALFQALGPAVMQDRELAQALRETLVEPEIRALQEIVRRGVERGEVPADHPALEYIPAQLLGLLRLRPILEGRHADEEYLTRFVDAVMLPGLGLT